MCARLPALLLILAMVATATARPVPARAATPDDPAEARERIEQLKQAISEVRAQLEADRRERDQASARLAQLEQRIATAAGRIDALDSRIERTRARLDELAARREELSAALARHRDTLAAQLRAAHRLGRQPALRLLLRQEQPGQIARTLGYYGYFNRARLDAIERARTLVTQLARVTEQTRAAERRLEGSRDELATQRGELEQARARRRKLLAELKARIAERGDELDRLQARRQRLGELLKELESVVGDLPAAPLEEQPFDTRTGALPWPAQGALRARFGAARAEGRMQWRGLVIDAPVGSPVEAVYYGRVVFADWLEGFGQLLIVDHLDGYLSLYGYNQRLLRSTGDWVKPGETIARVGASGGQDSPGLYFEIRNGGQPVNPLDWLAAR